MRSGLTVARFSENELLASNEAGIRRVGLLPELEQWASEKFWFATGISDGRTERVDHAV